METSHIEREVLIPELVDAGRRSGGASHRSSRGVEIDRRMPWVAVVVVAVMALVTAAVVAVLVVIVAAITISVGLVLRLTAIAAKKVST
jgi:hypothetical protein